MCDRSDVRDYDKNDIGIGGVIKDLKKLADADEETPSEEDRSPEINSGRPVRKATAPIKYRDYEVDFRGYICSYIYN